MQGLSFHPDYPCHTHLEYMHLLTIESKCFTVLVFSYAVPFSLTTGLSKHGQILLHVEGTGAGRKQREQRCWRFRLCYESGVSCYGSGMRTLETPRRYHNNLLLLPRSLPVSKSHTPTPTARGCLPGRHVSMYLPTVCLSATVANQFLINHLKASSAIPFISPPQGCGAN